MVKGSVSPKANTFWQWTRFDGVPGEIRIGSRAWRDDGRGKLPIMMPLTIGDRFHNWSRDYNVVIDGYWQGVGMERVGRLDVSASPAYYGLWDIFSPRQRDRMSNNKPDFEGNTSRLVGREVDELMKQFLHSCFPFLYSAITFFAWPVIPFQLPTPNED